MSTTFFSKKYLRKLQRPYHRALLQCLGYNKNTSTQVCYGSKTLMGIGIKCLYLEQGCKGIMTFMRHWRDRSIISTLLRITIGWVQHATGTGISIFKDTRELPHLESKWINFIRQFLRHINATFELDKEFIPTLQREHDSYIMDHILDSKRFSNAEIKRLNYCRQWLQVQTISDITQASGTRLHLEFFNGRHTLMTPATTNLKFWQGKPNEKTWKLWKRASLLWASKHGKLHQSLGKWLVAPADQRMRRFSYMDPEDNAVYLFDGSHFRRYNTYFNLLLPIKDDEQYIYESISNSVLPNDLRKKFGRDFRMDPTYATIMEKAPAVRPTSFKEYIANLPGYAKLLLDDLEWKCSISEVKEAIEEGITISATDGSAKENNSSFAWVLSTSSGVRLVTNTGNSNGIFQYSYRSEIHGILSLHYFYYHFCAFQKINHPTEITNYTDSASFIAKYHSSCLEQEGLQKSTSFFASEWDLLSELKRIEQETKAICITHHVKSHQDKSQKLHQLPLEVQLNIAADQLAER